MRIVLGADGKKGVIGRPIEISGNRKALVDERVLQGAVGGILVIDPADIPEAVVDMFQMAADMAMAVHLPSHRRICLQVLAPGNADGILWRGALSEGRQQGLTLEKTVFVYGKPRKLQPFVDFFIWVGIQADKEQSGSLKLFQCIVQPVNLLGKNRAIPFQLPP